ncbi:hypothetical protein LINPERHAP1_LOCUS16115 [Linum perenne]
MTTIFQHRGFSLPRRHVASSDVLQINWVLKAD